MDKESDKTFIFDLIVLAMTIWGIVLIFTSADGNIITPLAGALVASIGVFYFKTFKKIYIKELLTKLALFKPRREYIKVFINYFKTDNDGYHNAIEKEKIAENQRRDKFTVKFPRLNKIPLIGSISKSVYKEGFKYIVGILIILALASTLLFYNLGGRDIYEDEHQVVAAATGYLYTGEFHRWDFITDEVVCSEFSKECYYDRAWIHSFLIAQSYKIFGISEWSSRLVSVLFTLLLIFLAYPFTKFFTEDKRIALFTSFIFSINPSFIQLGRYTRMYALLLPLFLILAYLFYRGITGKIDLKFIKWGRIRDFIKKYFNFNYIYLLLGFVFLFLIYNIHINSMVLMPALLIYVALMAVINREKKYIALTLLGIISITIAVMISATTTILGQITNFLSFFQRNNSIYLDYLTQYPLTGKISIAILLLGFVSLILISNKRIRDKLIYLYSIVIFSLIFFIYIADRYSSFVYISHVSAISLMLIVYFYLSFVLRLKSKLLKYILIIILIINPLQALWLKTGSLYRNDNKLGNLSVAYKTIIDNYDSDNDVILGQYLRKYYLDDLDSQTKVIKMLSNKKYLFETFIDDINKYESGWITWESRKGYHIDKNIREYINNNFKKVHGQDVDDTKVEVYYFDKTMIPLNENYVPNSYDTL